MKVVNIVVAAAVGIALVGVAFDVSAKEGRKGRKQALEAINLASGHAPTNGGSCGTPTAFTSSPYADTGTTVGATNIIGTIPTGCSDYTTVAGPEVVYSFVPGTAANLTFNVANTDGTYDPSIYLVSTCNVGATCIAGADYNYYGGTDETFSVSTLSAGTTYYLHVDSFYSAAQSYNSGPFNLNVTGTFPVQLQEFSID